MARANVRIRLAAVDDVEQIAGLVRSIDTSAGACGGRPLADPAGDRLEARITAMLARDDRTVLLAVDESAEPVGMVAVKADDVGAIDLTPVVHVTHLMVTPKARRRGIGRALLAAAVKMADETGVEHVLATAAAGSREANRYLARIGFAPLVVHRLASTATLRRTLGLTDASGRVAVLRRARLARAQRAGFAARAAGGA
ncbi:GNAT family N-acetyltransferase [uncultured Jatrophihabitans sp.]|uniref:GNAT family N-acetyltransferase n=1 Tax=uncultured Jatrophihabitans sp. TaxID=1610747 RepID=UPI0035CA9788